MLCIRFIAVTVSFEQSAYSVDEDDGPAEPVLVLNRPSSTPITVRVSTTHGYQVSIGIYYSHQSF